MTGMIKLYTALHRFTLLCFTHQSYNDNDTFYFFFIHSQRACYSCRILSDDTNMSQLSLYRMSLHITIKEYNANKNHQGRSQDFLGLVSFLPMMEVPALGTSEAGPAAGGGVYGGILPQENLEKYERFPVF